MFFIEFNEKRRGIRFLSQLFIFMYKDSHTLTHNSHTYTHENFQFSIKKTTFSEFLNFNSIFRFTLHFYPFLILLKFQANMIY